jgi:hypothetical protein
MNLREGVARQVCRAKVRGSSRWKSCPGKGRVADPSGSTSGCYADRAVVAKRYRGTTTMRRSTWREERCSIALVMAVAAACGGMTNRDAAVASNTRFVERSKEHASDRGAGDAPLSACGNRSQTTLPGVRIEFLTQRCSWRLEETATGLRIDYVVVVAGDIDGIQPVPQDEGGCDEPGPSGLILFEEVGGNGQRYCLCDKGLCPGLPQKRMTLRKGRYPGAFLWDGRNWSGMSDTEAAKGDPFPVGRYTLVVSAVGNRWDGERDVTFQVTGC